MAKPKKSKKKSPLAGLSKKRTGISTAELLEEMKAKERWKTDPGLSLFDKVSTAREVMKQAGLTGKKHPESRRRSKD